MEQEFDNARLLGFCDNSAVEMAAMFIAIRRKIAARVRLLRTDQRGNIAVMMAFLLPVLIGGLGLGFEVSNWYLQTRAMLNAADSAAIAAATNAGSNYDVEAKAVAPIRICRWH